MRRLARLYVVLTMMVALLAPTTASAADGEPPTTTPIRHFITLMQENHAFDNYFGTYPGADGTPEGTCMPVDPTKPGGECIKPHHLGNVAVKDLGHNRDIFNGEYRNGKMDGFVSAHKGSGIPPDLAMGFYDRRDIPYYWNIASQYVLFDRFFTSAAGGSVWNHLFWVTGTPGNPSEDDIPPHGFGDLPTIFDRLQKKGVSWKFYVQNYDPTITYRSREGRGDRGSQVVWNPLLAYDRYLDDPELFGHIVDLSEYYQDLNNNTLPAVAYIVPSGASEHPPGSIQAGERSVRTLINALTRSSSWNSSAFMWSYDDWGGWYDHVAPPQVDKYGYGFRAPALLVSPYARQGFIDHTQLDFTSELKFIEENWGVAPLAGRDAAALSLTSAFDFSSPPRAPAFVSGDVDPSPRPPDPNRFVIYAAYVGALGLALLLMLGAAGKLPGIAALRARSLGRWPGSAPPR